MDEFKPEDELKPDASDRRPSRPRKSSSAPKVPVSRQHMMMGIGILVLLLLVLGIGSALNGSDESKPASTGNNPVSSGGSNATGDRNIDLTESTSMAGGQNTPATEAPAENSAPVADNASSAPRDVSMPAVSSTPTQAAPVEAPANQQRVTLPGDLNSALSNQQQQVDNATQSATSSLPTAPATVSGNANSGTAAPAIRPAPVKNSTPARAQQEQPHRTASKPATSESKTHTTPARPVTSGSGTSSTANSASSTSLPGGNYTLQLSGASRADSLNAWAKKQNLSSYHVYKTTRNGQSWFVLVSGSYATPADAKRAVASLPAGVRAQNPWVKPLSQVKKEAQ